MLTFLIKFLPKDKIFSLDIPAKDIMRSILFVESARRLQTNWSLIKIIQRQFKRILGAYSQFLSEIKALSIFAIGGIWQ